MAKWPEPNLIRVHYSNKAVDLELNPWIIEREEGAITVKSWECLGKCWGVFDPTKRVGTVLAWVETKGTLRVEGDHAVIIPE